MSKKNLILALAVVLIFCGIFKPKFNGWTPSDPAVNTIEITPTIAIMPFSLEIYLRIVARELF